jgi:GWxTD domain-containing protein
MNGNEFRSGLTVNIEVRDSLDNFITRAFDDQNISEKDFEVTNSRTTNLQGLIDIKLKEGKYKLTAIISDKTSKRERKIPPIDFVISKSEKVLDPIVLQSKKSNCDEKDDYVLLNNSSVIPFNKPEDILAIPVTDSTIKSLTINVTRRDTTFITNEEIKQFSFNSAGFELCSDKIILHNNNAPDLKYFLLNNFSANLSEGPIRLEVILDNIPNKKKVFNLQVIWIGKPFSLKDPEKAIKLLSNIESDDKVNELLKGDDELKELNDYWQKFDPTPGTKYNELMNEFYERVDYSDKTFKSIDGKGGADSDRGKTYVKFGAPDRIDRDTTNEDKVVESWYYNNPKRIFVFVDNNGTGKYTLVKEQ